MKTLSEFLLNEKLKISKVTKPGFDASIDNDRNGACIENSNPNCWAVIYTTEYNNDEKSIVEIYTDIQTFEEAYFDKDDVKKIKALHVSQSYEIPDYPGVIVIRIS